MFAATSARCPSPRNRSRPELPALTKPRVAASTKAVTTAWTSALSLQAWSSKTECDDPRLAGTCSSCRAGISATSVADQLCAGSVPQRGRRRRRRGPAGLCAPQAAHLRSVLWDAQRPALEISVAHVRIGGPLRPFPAAISPTPSSRGMRCAPHSSSCRTGARRHRERGTAPEACAPYGYQVDTHTLYPNHQGSHAGRLWETTHAAYTPWGYSLTHNR